jgi:hypothetical protein
VGLQDRQELGLVEGVSLCLSWFFINTETQRRYEVVKLDKAAGTITLKGELAEFTESYDKDKFKELGYTLIREEEAEDEDAE